MSKKDDPFGIDMSAIAGAMQGLQDAFAEGLGAMGQVNQKVAADMTPTHEIIVNVVVSAQVEGHDYKLDARLTFEAELAPVLDAEMPEGGLAAALGGLGVDTDSDEGSAIMEQLAQPRVVGVLKQAKVNELALYGDSDRIEAELNQNATMLITIDGDKLRFSFESALAFPELQAAQTVYCAIPSGELMQENIVLDKAQIGQKLDFSWKEADKDGLQISGSLSVSEL